MQAARIWFAATMIAGLAAAALAQQGQPANSMSFFVTSAGPGKGANPGGLLGADRHCQTLAMAAGAGNKTWHAYLSENGSRRPPDGQREGAYWQRPLVQRERCAHREQRRRAAQRQEQHQQDDGVDGKG